MYWNKLFEFNSFSREVTCNDRVVLANTVSGKWIKIPKESFNLICDSIKNNLTIRQFITLFESEVDKKYIIKMLENLLCNEILCYKGEEVKPKLNNVQFAVTNRCNLSCIHCSYNASNINGEDYLSTQQIKDCIDKFISIGVEHITITGGEPLLRKDILEILDYTRSHFSGNLTLMTNGLLINENNVDQLITYLNSFNISIDGIDEETCSKIRGKGVFDKVVKVINLLKMKDVKNIEVSMVVTDITQNYVSKFRSLAKEWGVTPCIRYFSPIGRGAENKNKLLPHEDNYKLKINNKNANRNRMKCRSCMPGVKTLNIDYDGSIYPCGTMIYKEMMLSNILDIDNFELFNNQTKYNTKSWDNMINMLPENHPECKKCNLNIFCWTCPGVFLGALNSKLQFQNHCDNSKNAIYQEVWL